MSPELPLAHPAWLTRDWIRGIFLTLAILFVYQPVQHADLVWDDHMLVGAANPPTFVEIWTTSAADNCPLTRTVFGLERSLWGLDPLPYHIVNVLIHAACAVLLWLVLRRLKVPGDWMAAAIWALHPVMVESVAWAAEMKNTLSGVFFLLSIIFFLPAETRVRLRYVLSMLFAALAMASKASTVILPGILCLCVWWVDEKWHWRTLLKAVPAFVMAGISSLVTIWTGGLQVSSSRDPVLHPEWIRSWPARLIAAGEAVWFYIGKLLWPHPQSAVYRRWEIDPGQWIEYLPLAGVILTLGLLWIYRETWARPYFFAFACFLTALLPVLGLAEQPIIRYSFVFDHFQYLASMAFAALVGAAFSQIAKRRTQVLTAGIIILALGTVTRLRVPVFQTEETLWSDTVAKNPRAWGAHNGLGNALLAQGRLDEAIDHFEESLETNLNNAEPHNGWGVALTRKKQYDAAIAQFNAALHIDPDYASARDNLAKVQLMSMAAAASAK